MNAATISNPITLLLLHCTLLVLLVFSSILSISPIQQTGRVLLFKESLLLIFAPQVHTHTHTLRFIVKRNNRMAEHRYLKAISFLIIFRKLYTNLI